jgi:MFS family permease
MSEDQNRRDQSGAWFALWVLFAINMMNFYDRQILAAVTEPIRKAWSLSDAQMGWLTPVFTIIYAFAGVPLGRWADRGQRKKILSLGVTVWSFFTAASGLAWNYWSMLVARLGVGVGEASCAPTGNSLIGDLYPANQRARAISIFMLGLPLGIFFSNLFSGMIAKSYGWQMTFFVAAVPGLILALLALKIREPKRGAAEAFKVAETAQVVSPYRGVLGIPTMWWIILSGALHNFNAYAVNAWTPAYLQRYHGMDIAQANKIAAYVLGAVGVVGLLAGGVAADWVRRVRPNGRMLLSAMALLVSTPCVYLAYAQPKGQTTMLMLLMSFGWMLIYIYYVTVYPAIQDVVEPNLRATAMALYFFAMYMLGGAFGPLIVGALSDHYANAAMIEAGAGAMSEAFKAEGLHRALINSVPLVSGLLTLVLFAGARTITKDMKKLELRMSEPITK